MVLQVTKSSGYYGRARITRSADTRNRLFLATGFKNNFDVPS